MSDLLQDLRMEIAASGRSLNSIARESGVDRANLAKFVNRRSGLSISSMERVADALGLTPVFIGEEEFSDNH